jgi:hypothetical protein
VRLTHDVDDPLATLAHGPRDFVRQLAGGLVRRREPRLAARRLRSLADRRADPNNTFDFPMDVSDRHVLRSAFYFLAHRNERPRIGACLFEHPWVHRLMGHVGVAATRSASTRASARTATPRATREGLARLLRVAEARGVRQDEWGGRQHFLRWAKPDTWRDWEAAGLSYDSTLAYSEAIGVPHRHLPFQPRLRPARAPAAAPARGAVPGDGATMRHAMALRPDAARAAVLDIAAQCPATAAAWG